MTTSTPIPQLDSVDLEQKIDKKSYRSRLREAQTRIVNLRDTIINQKLPIILVFEGWDAAGKGGAIRRLVEYVDARMFTIEAIAAPTAIELDHHYLWRFWSRIPQRGHISIFDRSWYGRVLVERVEGFAKETEWQRAYQEINDFEQQLCNDGYIIQKFFLHISFDEQGKRFESRRKDPLKSWKLTEEDYRNREKHQEYTSAINDMLAKTHSQHAPWHVIPANNKRYARIATIEAVADALECYRT